MQAPFQLPRRDESTLHVTTRRSCEESEAGTAVTDRRISLGHHSPATDAITIINLGSQMNDAAVHYDNACNIRLDHPALEAISAI